MEENHLKPTDIRTENEPDKRLVEKVFSYKQEHVFRWWNDLSANEQKNLLNQLRLIDFTLLQDLIEKHIEGSILTNPKTTILEPPDSITIPQNDIQKAHYR